MQSASPAVANVLAHSGMDFVTIDMEHGPASFETAESILYAIEAGGSTPMIRLGEGSAPTILRALDIGCQGILVAHVSTPEEALAISRATHYHPEGDRGLAPFTRLHDYSGDDLPQKLAEANEQMLTGILIEDELGHRNLEGILETPGLDLVYLGIYDLSQVLGVAGDVMNPKVVETVRAAVEQIEAKGMAAGAVCRDREHARFLLECGFRYLSYLVDTAILRDGFASARDWYEQLLRER
ncbi:MAG: HpcH/HpaI aldolase family protein [Thermoleophilaceae bacterium]